MSLQRVSSVESWERPRGQSPGPPQEHRRVTFNPIEDIVPPLHIEQHSVSPAQTSVGRRALQVAIASLYCLFAAGLVFGFAAFKPVLVKEGAYGYLCSPDDPSRPDLGIACDKQEIRLNLMFTSAAVVTNVAALPVGTILDRFGPRVSTIIGAAFLAAGSGFMIAAKDSPIDGYMPGYICLALGGPFVYISAFQLSNCFPRHSGLILALLTGAFDSSSAVFLMYRLAYDVTNGSIPISQFFATYLVVPVFILIVQISIMPSQSYKTVGEMVKAVEVNIDSEDPVAESAESELERRRKRRSNARSELAPLIGKRAERDKAWLEAQRKRKVSGVWGALHGLSAFQQIRTPWWALCTLFVMLQMTRINYFVATIRSQYAYLLDGLQEAVRINHIFDVALPAGGVIAVPFVGLILDNLSTVTTLSLLVGMATVIGVLGTIPYEWAAYLNVMLFVIYRPFYYTAVSDFAAKVFGFHTFGKVYGLIICISGIFNFVQSGLDALTHLKFNGDPLPVNLMLLLAALLVGAALVGYVYRKSLTMARDWLEEEAEDAIEAIIPDAIADVFDGESSSDEEALGIGHSDSDNRKKSTQRTDYGTTA